MYSKIEARKEPGGIRVALYPIGGPVLSDFIYMFSDDYDVASSVRRLHGKPTGGDVEVVSEYFSYQRQLVSKAAKVK